MVNHGLCHMHVVTPFDHVPDVTDPLRGPIDRIHVHHKAHCLLCTLSHVKAIDSEVSDNILDVVFVVQPKVGPPWGFGVGYRDYF